MCEVIAMWTIWWMSLRARGFTSPPSTSSTRLTRYSVCHCVMRYDGAAFASDLLSRCRPGGVFRLRTIIYVQYRCKHAGSSIFCWGVRTQYLMLKSWEIVQWGPLGPPVLLQFPIWYQYVGNMKMQACIPKNRPGAADVTGELFVAL
jgi:hypothetical protein